MGISEFVIYQDTAKKIVFKGLYKSFNINSTDCISTFEQGSLGGPLSELMGLWEIFWETAVSYSLK